MSYIIGKAGQVPRMIIEGTADQADAQVQSGEVCFEQDSVPPAPHSISQDGTALVAVTPDPTVVVAQKWADIRFRRNGLLNVYAWTVAPGSPLNSSCQGDWLSWIKTMNRLTIDYTDPDSVVWPALPALSY